MHNVLELNEVFFQFNLSRYYYICIQLEIKCQTVATQYSTFFLTQQLGDLEVANV